VAFWKGPPCASPMVMVHFASTFSTASTMRSSQTIAAWRDGGHDTIRVLVPQVHAHWLHGRSVRRPATSRVSSAPAAYRLPAIPKPGTARPYNMCAHLKHSQNVGMIQRRRRHRLLLEAAQALGIGRCQRGQDFDRHLAS